MTDKGIPAGIRRSFRDVPVICKGDYHYFIHPLSDGIRSVEPELLSECVEMVVNVIRDRFRPDLLVTAEAMGIPLTTAVSQRTGIPFSVARKRSYGIRGEVEVAQSTGYSSNSLFFNLPDGSGSTLVLDDVLSTGGTLRAIVEGLARSSTPIEGAIVLFNKMEDRRNELSVELGIPIITLLDVDVDERGCRISASSE